MHLQARWLSKRSRLETVCLVFVGFLLLLVLSLGVSLGIVATHTRVSYQGYHKGQIGGSTGKM